VSMTVTGNRGNFAPGHFNVENYAFFLSLSLLAVKYTCTYAKLTSQLEMLHVAENIDQF
jgi:hypothetical protein